MYTKIKRVIGTSKSWDDYMDRLDYVLGFRSPHAGEPKRYPVLTVSEIVFENLFQGWSHRFIYSSNLDDLYSISEKMGNDDEVIETYLKNIGEKGLETVLYRPGSINKMLSNRSKEEEQQLKEQAKWNDFWDDFEEDVSKAAVQASVAAEGPLKEEEQDVLEIQSLLYKSPSEAINKIEVYMETWWPDGYYLDAVRKWLDGIKKNEKPSAFASIRPYKKDARFADQSS